MKPLAALASRRSVLAGAIAALATVACSKEEDSSNGAQNQRAAPTLAAMTVYRDPSCGCCEAWAKLAQEEGYQVTVVDDPEMPAIKKRLGVPEKLTSCHTALVEGYAIEGHVPFKHVARLLRDRPKDIKGIAVPGMPRGSPGMETSGRRDIFFVIAFDAQGKGNTYAA